MLIRRQISLWWNEPYSSSIHNYVAGLRAVLGFADEYIDHVNNITLGQTVRPCAQLDIGEHLYFDYTLQCEAPYNTGRYIYIYSTQKIYLGLAELEVYNTTMGGKILFWVLLWFTAANFDNIPMVTWLSLHGIIMLGLILGLRPANERRRYFGTTSLIGWAQA